jgi:hypothetical protein
MGSYLLDTQGMRSINGRELAVAAGTHPLLMSPVSFWEIISHLDEIIRKKPAPQASFEQWKAVLLKCRIPTLLEDPFASLASRAGVPSLVNPTRFEDRQGIPLILDQLDQSATLDDFAVRQIALPGSGPRPIRDVAARTRACLCQVEDDYRRSIEQTAAKIIGEIGLEKARNLSGTDFYCMALRAVAAGVYQDAVQGGQPDRDLFDRLAVAGYICGGYMVARILRSFVNNGYRDGQVAVDPNDTEDFMVTMHMSYDQPLALVTGDAGTREAVRRALDELGRHAAALGVTTIQARVIDVPVFRAETLGGGA